ncbi:hypothetical protein QBC33DRAFT_593400 [Phialemonium atrogriseum]|uniref:Uncharacterized protein n=1 Tax=Phialemonium atrogriseum TaxID=1093897 RepID=A0AAJ0FK84_9PEZI|nr:uncharacterized protein QBC33DRAFT_593400 [Phialemonium atrogriseum]KAK1765284.1 hypothetical protein QBC33DRAFT_593400 [Phialemonium atrogriseum]
MTTTHNSLSYPWSALRIPVAVAPSMMMVMKKTATAPPPPPLVSPCTLTAARSLQLTESYHTRPFHALSGVSVEQLLASVAWTLFTEEMFPFFGGMQEYALGNARPQIRAKTSLFEAFPRSRGVSPSKNKFPTDDQVEGWEKEDEDEDEDKIEDKQWCRPDDGGMAALLAVEMEHGGSP